MKNDNLYFVSSCSHLIMNNFRHLHKHKLCFQVYLGSLIKSHKGSNIILFHHAANTNYTEAKCLRDNFPQTLGFPK